MSRRHYEDRATLRDGIVPEGRVTTRHVGPKPKPPWVPDSISIDRLTALLPSLTVDEQRDVLRIIDARGRGYGDLAYLVARYERVSKAGASDPARDYKD